MPFPAMPIKCAFEKFIDPPSPSGTQPSNHATTQRQRSHRRQPADHSQDRSALLHLNLIDDTQTARNASVNP
jgi:hypothetical protein